LRRRQPFQYARRIAGAETQQSTSGTSG
jgi:hypothetical protein